MKTTPMAIAQRAKSVTLAKKSLSYAVIYKSVTSQSQVRLELS
jgi:hypothetical protein